MKNALQKQIQVKLRPEENIEYTFIFLKKEAGRVVKRLYTLIYLGTNQKKRDMFYNKTTKSITYFSYGYFAFLKRKRFVSAIPVDVNETENTKPQEHVANFGPCAKEDVIITRKESFEEETIRTLREASFEQELSVFAKIGVWPKDIANDLAKILLDEEDCYTQDFVNKTFSNMMLANDIIKRRDGKNLFNIR